jgi:hypothetical protein
MAHGFQIVTCLGLLVLAGCATGSALVTGPEKVVVVIDGRESTMKCIMPTIRISSCSRLQGHRDLPVVFQRGDPNVFNLRAARGAQSGRQLVTGQQFAAHDLFINDPVVNESAG